MPQVHGNCGHLKDSLNSHPSCLNCCHCCRLSTCTFCFLWPDELWSRLENRRTYQQRKMGKKETKEKPKKGFSSRSRPESRSSKAVEPGHVDLPGPTSRDQDGVLHSSKSQTPSGGVLRLGDSSPGRSSHGATSKKGTSGSLSSHCFTPTEPHPGDSEGKYKSPPVTEVAASSPTYVQGSDSEVIPLGSGSSPGRSCLGVPGTGY